MVFVWNQWYSNWAYCTKADVPRVPEADISHVPDKNSFNRVAIIPITAAENRMKIKAGVTDGMTL